MSVGNKRFGPVIPPPPPPPPPPVTCSACPSGFPTLPPDWTDPTGTTPGVQLLRLIGVIPNLGCRNLGTSSVSITSITPPPFFLLTQVPGQPCRWAGTAGFLAMNVWLNTSCGGTPNSTTSGPFSALLGWTGPITGWSLLITDPGGFVWFDGGVAAPVTNCKTAWTKPNNNLVPSPTFAGFGGIVLGAPAPPV